MLIFLLATAENPGWAEVKFCLPYRWKAGKSVEQNWIHAREILFWSNFQLGKV